MLKYEQEVRRTSNKDLPQGYFNWLWILILCLGFGLRVASPHVSSFWQDEVMSLYRAGLGNWAEYFQKANLSGHGPIYEWLILNPWIRLGQNEFYVRAPTILLGVLNNVVVLSIGRRFFNNRTALLSGLIFALSAFHIEYTQEARPYVLASLLSALSMLFFVRVFWEKPTRAKVSFRHFIGYGLFASLALYSHYTTAFMLFVLALWGYGHAVLQHDWKLFWTWSLVQVLILLSFVPWLGIFLNQYKSQPYAWISSQGLQTKLRFVPQVYWHPSVIDWPIIYALCGGLVVASLLTLYWSSKRGFSTASLSKGLFLMGAAWGPVFVGAIVSLLWHPFFVYRYFLYTVTPAALLMGWILVALLAKQRLSGMVMILMVVVSMAFSAYRWTCVDWKEDWRGLVQYLDRAPQDSIVVLSYRHFLLPFNYYYQGSLPVRAVPASVSGAEQVLADAKAYRYVWVVRGVPRFPPRADVWEVIVQGLPITPIDCENFGMVNKLELCVYEHEP